MTVLKSRVTIRSLLAKAYPNQFPTAAGSPVQIRVDDYCSSKDSYPGFCHIHLKVPDVSSSGFVLTLSNAPSTEAVKTVAAKLGGIWESTRTGERLILELSASNADELLLLAAAIKDVVAPGQHYEDRNWKWIARRTERSLVRLAKVFAKAT